MSRSLIVGRLLMEDAAVVGLSVEAGETLADESTSMLSDICKGMVTEIRLKRGRRVF